MRWRERKREKVRGRERERESELSDDNEGKECFLELRIESPSYALHLPNYLQRFFTPKLGPHNRV
jgi:hypothetical protein